MVIAGRDLQPRARLTGPPEVLSERIEEAANLLFYIESFTRTADGWTAIAKGNSGATTVAVRVRYVHKGAVEPAGGTINGSGRIFFETLGAPSDEFVRALARAYEVDAPAAAPPARRMSARVQALALGLQGDLARPDAAEARLKCFIELDPPPADEEEDSTLEFFVFVDVGTARLTLAEKDEGYRAGILRVFTAP